LRKIIPETAFDTPVSSTIEPTIETSDHSAAGLGIINTLINRKIPANI
jgi:hypothetical protein